MHTKYHHYISKKNPLLWIATAFLLASAGCRIWIFSQVAEVALGRQIICPVAATVLYVLFVLLGSREMLFRSAVPVWLMGVCVGWQLHFVLQGRPLLLIFACLGVLFFCVSYTRILAGRRKQWLMLPLYLVALGIIGYIHYQFALRDLCAKTLLADYVLLLGLVLLLFAMKNHTDGKFHPTWKDRSDGRYIRTAAPFDQMIPYIMPDRTGANNLFDESVEITNLERYVRAKRREGMLGFGITHAIIAAYVRTVAKYPAVNRFVAGQRIYARGEDIAMCMATKKEMSKDSLDTVIKVHFTPADTARDVYKKFNSAVSQAKNESTGVDDAAGILTAIPRLVLKGVMGLIRLLDYFGLLPAFLLEVSPFHGSVFFTSMGSLGIRPVYHHLYDFGTIPAFCAFGRKRRAQEICDGELVERKYIDLRFNLDERICDGYYYASVIKYFLSLLRHPEVLDQPPETIEQDIP